jgi:hypothetical protein
MFFLFRHLVLLGGGDVPAYVVNTILNQTREPDSVAHGSWRYVICFLKGK